MNNKLIAAYSDDCDTPWEISQLDWEYLTEEADTVLSSKSYVRVVGSTNVWNGSHLVDLIITETTLNDIISTYINIDQVNCEVYPDRVEFKNIHHDGTNSYTFYPFSFDELTIPQLKEYFDEYDIEDFNAVDYLKPFHSAYKSDLIDFIERYDLYK